MKIYLDNCCYNRPYDDQSQLQVSLESLAKIQIQKDITLGKYELVSSFILVYENSKNPYENRRIAIEEFIKKNSSEYIAKDKISIILGSIESIMDTGIKKKDAVHLACAIYAGCEYLISTDKRLLKYKTDKIKLMNPMNFIGREEAI